MPCRENQKRRILHRLSQLQEEKTDRDSFSVCNHEFEPGPTIYITKGGLRMTKAGIVRAKFPCRPRNGWKLKRVTMEKTRSGKYFAYETTIGLKYSMSRFYVAEGGELAQRSRK